MTGIDRMADEGMQFTHLLTAEPISDASRAGLFTGIPAASAFRLLIGQYLFSSKLVYTEIPFS